MNYEEASRLCTAALTIRAEDKSSKEAFDMLLKSAIGGYENAMVAVAFSYRDGEGIEKNATEALKWFTLAADRGNVIGISCLDSVYRTLYGDTWEDYYIPVMKRYAAMGYQRAIEKLAFHREYCPLKQNSNQNDTGAIRRTQENTGTMKLPSGTGRTEYNRIKLFILVISIISCIFLLAHC